MIISIFFSFQLLNAPPTLKRGRGKEKQGGEESRVIGYIHFTPLYEITDYIYTHLSLTGGLCPKSSSCNTNNKNKQKNIKLRDNSIFIAV